MHFSPNHSWLLLKHIRIILTYVPVPLYMSICIALYHDSSLKRSGMARVNEGSHSFTCHPHVYPQVEWTIHAFTPQPQIITALRLVLISCPAEGRRMSWPELTSAIISSIPSLFLNWQHVNLSVTLTPHIHLIILISACWTVNTIQHKTVLIIFPLILQTFITAQMSSTGEEGEKFWLIQSWSIMLTELHGNWHLCSCWHFRKYSHSYLAEQWYKYLYLAKKW